MTYASLCGLISWAMTIKLPLLQRFYQSELLGPFRQRSKNTSNVLTLPNVTILYKWSCIPSIYKFRLDTLCVSSVVYFRVYHYIKWNLIHISTDRELLCIYIVLFLKKKGGGRGSWTPSMYYIGGVFPSSAGGPRSCDWGFMWSHVIN